MPDTMTLTKTVGSVCGALLIFLLGNWAGEALYSVGGGHGHEEQAYTIDTGDETGEATGADDGAAPEEASFQVAYASADVSAGESAFNQCRACHKAAEAENGVGPHLLGVVGRDVASIDGFGYSNVLGGMDGEWTPETLDPWLENPAEYAPGTTMGFAGIEDVQERADLIAYLQTHDGDESLAPSAYEGQESADTADADAAAQGDGTDMAAASEDSAEDRSAGAGDDAPEAGSDGSETASADAGDTDAAPAQSGDQEAGGGFAEMVAAADPSAGENVFTRCSACHAVQPGQNMVGPSLHGVVGREIASAEGFSYSDAIKGLDGAWTPAKLKEWIAAPMDVAPGTSMPPAGVTSDEDLAAVIAYLDSLDE